MNRSLIKLFPQIGRTLSTSSIAKAKTHVPPKKIHGTIGRYAGAIYTAASKVGMLDKVESELVAFSEIVKKLPNFASFLENPTISRTEKAAKVGELVTEPKFSYISRNLFLTLAANGRIGEASKVISAFEEIMAADRGSVKVTIISSEALKKKQQDTIQAGIISIVGAGKTIDIEAKVDESILGGLQVMIGDRFLDLSVSSRVAELSKSLEVVN